MFKTYILYSVSHDKYYIGHTSNLEDRIFRHNSGRSKYTKFGVPWQLVYLEEFNGKSEAYRRELEIKKLYRKADSRIEHSVPFLERNGQPDRNGFRSTKP